MYLFNKSFLRGSEAISTIFNWLYLDLVLIQLNIPVFTEVSILSKITVTSSDPSIVIVSCIVDRV